MTRLFLTSLLTFFIGYQSSSQFTYNNSDKSYRLIDEDRQSNQLLNVTIDGGIGSQLEYKNGLFVKGGLGFVFNVGQYYQLGPGFGVRYYNRKGEYTRLSVYLDNRIFFTKTRIKPYLRFNGGYGRDLNNAKLSGFFASGALGVWFGFNANIPFFIEAGGDYDQPGRMRDLGAFTVTIGIALAGG